MVCEHHTIDNERNMCAGKDATARCEQQQFKSMVDVGHSVEHGSCRVMLKNCDIRQKSTLIGLAIKILPGSNLEVRLDGMEDTVIISMECIRPADAESAVALAKSFFEGGFKAASIEYVQNLCTDRTLNQETILHISEWLISNGEYQEAETLLRKALKANPSVTSSENLRAKCALAELKSLLGQHDEAICLLEAVLQNDPDARSEHTFTALLRLSRAYTELGELAEATRIRALLQRAADARAAPNAAERIAAGATATLPTPVM